MNIQQKVSEFIRNIESEEKNPTLQLGEIIYEIKIFCQSNEQLITNSKKNYYHM